MSKAVETQEIRDIVELRRKVIERFRQKEFYCYQEATLAILDLLYQNAHRIKFVNDLSDGNGVLITEKWALPYVPFVVWINGKPRLETLANPARYAGPLQDFLDSTDEILTVSLKTTDKELRVLYQYAIG